VITISQCSGKGLEDREANSLSRRLVDARTKFGVVDGAVGAAVEDLGGRVAVHSLVAVHGHGDSLDDLGWVVGGIRFEMF
jgi:hypothetical protein